MGLTLGSRWSYAAMACQVAHAACHKRAIHSGLDRSGGQQRTTQGGLNLQSSRPSQVMIPSHLALGSRGSLGQGLHRPCRARPADRSLAAEDRSAGGVRDRTEPKPPMLTRLLTGRAATPRGERVQDGTTQRHPPSSEAW